MATKTKQPKSASYTVGKTIITARISGALNDRLQELASANRMTKSMLTRVMIENFLLSNNSNILFKNKSVCFGSRIPDRKTLGVSLDNDIYRKLDTIAQTEETTISEVVRAIVEYYTENLEECQNLLKLQTYIPADDRQFEMYIDLA